MLNDVLLTNRIKKSIVIIVFQNAQVSVHQGTTKYIARKKNLLIQSGDFTVIYECYVKHDSKYARYFTKAISKHCTNLNTSKSGPFCVYDEMVLWQLHYMCQTTTHCKYTLV